MNIENRSENEKDCSAVVRIAATAVICILAVIAFVPPLTIFGLSLRRANILSELISFDDGSAAAETGMLFDDDEELLADWNNAESAADGQPETADQVEISYEWQMECDSVLAKAQFRPLHRDTVRIHRSLTPIEDYDTVGAGGMSAFFEKLVMGEKPVRIAFLGDSFVEGDILTSDLRTLLQKSYGGAGFGFAPMSSPLTAYRRTVKTQSKGWASYNIMQYDRTPESLRRDYSVSGWVCQPADGAVARWECPDADTLAEVCTDVRVLFVCRSASRVEVTVDDAQSRIFDISGATDVREVHIVREEGIRSVSFRVVSGSEGFTGYGAVFGRDDRGVILDNYSIRSNSGQAMLRTDPAVNSQIDALLNYDMVVLQYGLNIMQQGVKDYKGYEARLDRIISYVRRCFPGAAILVLGVSDRCVRDASGSFESMDAVPYMTETQRRAAKNNSAAFWPTADAMRALGGMSRFVQNGWAGKDYTHITYAGGRRIAEMLFDALNAAAGDANIIRRREAEATLLDSVHLDKFESGLLTAPSLHAVIPENAKQQ